MTDRIETIGLEHESSGHCDVVGHASPPAGILVADSSDLPMADAEGPDELRLTQDEYEIHLIPTILAKLC
jgi:hypothetical protein